jgi:phospholipid/cholesterol/gamma-HCH transport system substrate-binding protein
VGFLRRAFGRAFTERNPVIIGAIGVTTILVVVALSIVLNKGDFGSGLQVRARFANAAGLRSGDQVLLAGVPVGTVTSLSERDGSVFVGMRISSSTQLPVDSGATIEVETLLGQLAVKLEPGQRWSDLMRSGATITDTQVPVEFQQLENSTGSLLSRSNVGALDQLVGDLAGVTKDKQGQVARILSGLDKLTATVDARQAQVGELIDASGQVAGALQARDRQLVAVIDHLGTVLSGLAARRAELSALITNTAAVANQTASLVGANRARLDSLLANLNSALDVVAAHQVDLAQGLSYLATAIQGFASIGSSGPDNYPNRWANVFTNLLGGGDSVYGSCGYLDLALDAALGPDPRPCSSRAGPQSVPTPTPSSGGTGPASPGPPSPGPASPGPPSPGPPSLGAALLPEVGR